MDRVDFQHKTLEDFGQTSPPSEGDRIPVALGTFADVAVDGPFSLIHVVFSTFFALLTQDEKARCFENVARKLTPEGVFVLEAYVPDIGRLTAVKRYG